MKVTLNELRSYNAGLNTIMARELPPETANWFKRLMKRFVSELQAHDRMRIKLIQKYAKKDEDGNPMMKRGKKGKRTNEYDLTKENLVKTGVEWDKITQREIDIPFEPLAVKRLGETITADILYQLGKLIEE